MSPTILPFYDINDQFYWVIKCPQFLRKFGIQHTVCGMWAGDDLNRLRKVKVDDKRVVVHLCTTLKSWEVQSPGGLWNDEGKTKMTCLYGYRTSGTSTTTKQGCAKNLKYFYGTVNQNNIYTNT